MHFSGNYNCVIMDLVRDFYSKPSTLSNYPIYQKGGFHWTEEQIRRDIARNPKLRKLGEGYMIGLFALGNALAAYQKYNKK